MAHENPIDLADQVAQVARSLGIESVLIGAYALAVHFYVRATRDIDLATVVQPTDLRRLEAALSGLGLRTRLRLPDDMDDLGGVLRVWEREDDDDEPLEPVDVVNFINPWRPRKTPASDAVRHGTPMAERPALRIPRLADLIALKLDAGSRSDQADVVAVLRQNPAADLDAIRATCKAYGHDIIDTLIEESKAPR